MWNWRIHIAYARHKTKLVPVKKEVFLAHPPSSLSSSHWVSHLNPPPSLKIIRQRNRNAIDCICVFLSHSATALSNGRDNRATLQSIWYIVQWKFLLETPHAIALPMDVIKSNYIYICRRETGMDMEWICTWHINAHLPVTFGVWRCAQRWWFLSFLSAAMRGVVVGRRRRRKCNGVPNIIICTLGHTSRTYAKQPCKVNAAPFHLYSLRCAAWSKNDFYCRQINHFTNVYYVFGFSGCHTHTLEVYM